MTEKKGELQSSSASERDFSDLRRTVIATSTSSLTRIVARILLIIFVVDLYGIGSFGYLGEVAASVELLAAMASLGLPKTIMAYFDRHRDDAGGSANLVTNALCLTGVTALGLSIILGLLWPLLFPYVPAYVAGSILIIALTEMMLTLTRSRRIIKWESIVKGVVKPWGFFILAMAGYFIFVQRLGAEPIIILMAAYFLSLILSAIFAFIGFFQIIKNGQIILGQAKASAMLALGKESAPIAIVDAGSFAFRRLDIIILGALTSSNITGIYYLGQQFATVVEKMRYLFEPMASPILAQTRSIETIGRYLKKTCRWVFAASLGVAIATTIYAQPLMELFDVYYMNAIIFMAILLIGEVIDGSTGLIELPIIFRNPMTASRNMILALIAEAICVGIGAYNFGILGAAAGYTSGMMVLATLRLYSVKKLYGMHILDRNFLKPIIAGMIASIISFLLKDYILIYGILGLIAAVLMCGTIYLYILKIMGISMKISDNS